MRLVRFGVFWSRAATSGEDTLRVLGDFGEQLGGDAGFHADNAGENARGRRSR